MALESRGAKKYFYASERVCGRVRKLYVAGGVAGQIAAEHFIEVSHERRLLKAKERVNLTRLSSLEQLVKNAHKQVEIATESYLRAAGFHRPGGGEWRRQRC